MLLAQATSGRSGLGGGSPPPPAAPAEPPIKPGVFSGMSTSHFGFWGWWVVFGAGAAAVSAGEFKKKPETGGETVVPDTVAPVLTITSTVGGTANGADSRIAFDFNFSEAVRGYDVKDVTVTHGVVDDWYYFTEGTYASARFTVYVVPEPGFEGAMTLAVSAGIAADAAGNVSNAASFAQTIDLTLPKTPLIEVVATDDIINRAEFGALTASGRAEPNAWVSISYGRFGAETRADAGGRWSVALEAQEIPVDTTTLAVSARVIDDGRNLSAVSTREVAVDLVAPGASIVFADTHLEFAETSVVTVVFSEPYADFSANWLTVDQGTLSGFASPDGGTTWVGTFVPAPAAYATDRGATLPAATITDIAGNANAAIGSNAVLIDTVPDVDLDDIAGGVGGLVIHGEGRDDSIGFGVVSVGDINGDGFADLVVPTPGTIFEPGKNYVVFGRGGAEPIELSDVAKGVGGFLIDGDGSGGAGAFSIGAAGDLNRDGLADLIVGSPKATRDAVAWSGRSYVVYGKTGGASVALSAVGNGDGGFVMDYRVPYEGYALSGSGVAGVGDFNGDGLADLVVGAPGARVDGLSGVGRAFVVFGKINNASVELSAVAEGAGGFVINGQCTGDLTGQHVAALGDINGDGLADLAVSAPNARDANGAMTGRHYVVFGRAGAAAALDLSAVAGGAGGFVVNGHCDIDLGGTLAAAGDVNGDGLADLVVGVWRNDAAGDYAGQTYVVFGRTGTAPVDLSAIAQGQGGFAVRGHCAGDRSGYSVASAGDVNGDGLADLLVGAPGAEPFGWPGDSDQGQVYLVFGKTDGATVDLAAVARGFGGIPVNGQSVDDGPGASVAAADLNRDGFSDLVIGAPGAGARVDPPGRVYVVFGGAAGAFPDTATERMGAVVNDRVVLDAGNVAALRSGAVGSQQAGVDGGGGVDTLALAGAGIHLDLTNFGNAGGTAPGDTSRLESFERIDLTGSGGNALTLNYGDVIDLSEMNVFNGSNGWSGLAAAVPRHQLVVDGDGDDRVNSGGGWVAAGTVSAGVNTYAVYNFGDYVQLLVDVDVSRNIG